LIGEDLRAHQRALRLAWSAAAVLLVSSVLTAWQWYQATVQRDLAEERLAQAVDITERMLFDIDDKLAGVAGAGELRRTLTYSALSLLIELRQKAARHQDVRWAQMAGYYQKGNLALRYGDLKEAEAAFVESQKIAKGMVDELPGYIEPYHSLALSYHALGNVKAQKQLVAEAYDAFDRAKQLADFILEDKPGDEDTQLLLINLYRDWGDLAYENRDIPTAHRNYAAGLELILRLVDENADDAEYLFIYATMLDRKARYYPIHADPRKLLEVREEAIDILRRLVDQFPAIAKYRLNLAIAYEKLGDVAFTAENFKGAKEFYGHAMAAMQALHAAEPINNLYKKMLAVNYGHLGKTVLALGRPNEALDLYEQEHAWMQTLTRIDPDNQEYALGQILARRHLGDYYARARNWSRSIEHYRSAIQLTRSYMTRHDRTKVGPLLMAAVRVELAEVLAGTDAAEAVMLIRETTGDVEHWLEEHAGDGEGWLYLGQAYATSFVVAARTGDAAGAGQAKTRSLAAVRRLSQSDRMKFAKEINSILKRLDEIPARRGRVGATPIPGSFTFVRAAP
jgi:tetratricopeptide (TPR) repeat protein